MNIQPISYYNVSMQAKTPPSKPGRVKKAVDKCTQKILDLFSTATFKDDMKTIKKMQKRDANLSHPAINRIIMGATALFLQPTIDACNKDVDKETRITSVCRTIAKILAGTFVGIIVRGSAHNIVTKMTDVNAKGKNSRRLIPREFLTKFTNEEVLLKNYRSALSTSIAILAMCITNFVFDAPLTVKLTNKFKAWVNSFRANQQEKEVEVALE